jgi:hypothetical protein
MKLDSIVEPSGRETLLFGCSIRDRSYAIRRLHRAWTRRAPAEDHRRSAEQEQLAAKPFPAGLHAHPLVSRDVEPCKFTIGHSKYMV